MQKSHIVFLVIVGGVLAIFFLQRPHTVCDAQKAALIQSQAGSIYSQQVKNVKRPAQFSKYLDICRQGASPGACYELFQQLRKLDKDIGVLSETCAVELASENEVKSALRESLKTFVQIGWGASIPVGTVQNYGWLEQTDLHLFCRLKRDYIVIFGRDEFEELRLQIQASLPGEAIIVENGNCKNCETRKKAVDLIAADEVWLKSLFALRCERILQ